MIIKNTLDLFKKNNFSYEDIIKKSKKDLEVNGFHVFKNVPLLVKNLKEVFQMIVRLDVCLVYNLY